MTNYSTGSKTYKIISTANKTFIKASFSCLGLLGLLDICQHLLAAKGALVQAISFLVGVDRGGLANES